MRRNIEHVVTSTAMFVIAFIVSTPSASAPSPRRRSRASRAIWSVGVALLLTALGWTLVVYEQQVAFCAHLRLHLQAPSVFHPGSPPPFDPEVIDLVALGAEVLVLAALVVLAVRSERAKRLAR
jgi:hypothetical protein